MAIKSKIKKIFLVILLVVISTALSAVRLFSGHGGSKTNQAQAQCWTPPGGGDVCGPGGCTCADCGCGCGGCGGY